MSNIRCFSCRSIIRQPGIFDTPEPAKLCECRFINWVVIIITFRTSLSITAAYCVPFSRMRQWCSKVGAGACERIPKGRPPSFPHRVGLRPHSDGPRALHALHTLLLRH